jgi:ribosomal protein S27E
MTAHESAMQDAQRLLDVSKCGKCQGYGATIHFDYGVTWITCDNCGVQASAPDAEIQTCLDSWDSWAQLTKQAA